MNGKKSILLFTLLVLLTGCEHWHKLEIYNKLDHSVFVEIEMKHEEWSGNFRLRNEKTEKNIWPGNEIEGDEKFILISKSAMQVIIPQNFSLIYVGHMNQIDLFRDIESIKIIHNESEILLRGEFMKAHFKTKLTMAGSQRNIWAIKN